MNNENVDDSQSEIVYDITNNTIVFILHLTASNAFVFPFVLSLIFSKWSISFASFIYCISANLRLYTQLNQNSESVRKVSVAVDAVCGVIVTCVCAFALQLNKTCVGTFRILWLVTLITSSTSYSFFKNLAQHSMIPNDISVIMLGVSGILLIFTALYSKLLKKNDNEFDTFRQTRNRKKMILVESLLVGAALLFRFDTEVANFIHVMIGTFVWHTCCSLALLVCIFVK